MKAISMVKNAAALCGAWLSAAFGGWDALLITLLLFMAVDYASGVARAAHGRELSSAVGFKGLLRKGGILLVVLVAAQLDRVAGGDTYAVRSMVCMFYTANEGISILENVAAMGVRLPQGLLRLLRSMQEEKQA